MGLHWLSLQIHLGNSDILKKLSFPIYELSIAFHLLVSALISIPEKKKMIFLIQGFYPVAAAANSPQ